jgi:hypothetical protein
MIGVLAPLFVILCPAEDPPVRVTVVIVLATTENTTVDPKLAELAKEVQKRDPKLTGFRIAATDSRSVPVGESFTFELVDREVLKVKVDKPKDAAGRVSLTIKPPGLENITYGCTCDKFFPVVTPQTTKAGGVLIVAVMAKPCSPGKTSSWFPWPDGR